MGRGGLTRGDGQQGTWAYIAIAGVMVTFGYALYALGSVYYRYRLVSELCMMLSVGLFFLSSIEGILARLSIINFIELGPFGVLAMVICMSAALTYITQQLRTSERNFRSLFDNSPTGMVAINPVNGRIVQANQVALNMIGYSAEEILTKTVADVTIPEDMGESLKRYEQLAKGLVDHMHYERRYLRKDGSSFLADNSISTLKDDNGKVVRFIGSATDITERKRTEDALRESEEKLRSLYELSPLGIALTDMKGRYVEFNKAFQNICGYPAEELKNLDYWTLTPRKYEADEAQQLESLERTGHYGPYEKEYVRKDGSLIPLRLNGVLVTGRDGQKFIWSIVEDISESKLAEMALKKESEKNLALLRNASDGIHILDIDGNLIEVSDSFCSMLGYQRHEMIGMNVSQWDAGFADAGEISAGLRQQFEKPVRSQFETKHRRKDGTVFDAEVSGFPLELGGIPVLFNSSRDITERKQSESSLRESESRFRTVIEQSPIGISLSRDGYTIDGNTAFLHMFGYDDIAEVRGQPVTNRIAPQCRDEMEDRIMRRIQNKPVETSYETIGLRKDGSQFPLFISAKRVMLSNGPLSCAFLIDITERKRTEASLRESESRFRNTLENAPIGMGIGTLDGKFLQVNRAFCEMFGYTKGELEKLSFKDITHPDDMASSRAKVQELKDGKISSYRLEKRYIRKDGQVVWAILAISAVKDESGVPMYVIGQIEDITSRKKAETELRIAATAFESQEGILITDVKTEILRVNHAFTNITGYSAEEVFGKTPRILSSGRHDAKFYAAMWDSINNLGAWDGEIWNRRKNGEIYPEHLSITAVKDQKGNITNYVASITDITLHKESEEKIKHLAFFDPLTGLPNRRLLLDRLQQALASSRRSGRLGAILFIDLDNFKTINDTLGHNIGDLLLQQVAQRLETCVREGDTVARLGGDEFVVVLEELSTDPLEAAAQTESVGEKILATLNQPYQLAVHEYRSSPSIGAILFNSHQKTMEEILQQADIAMYQAKKAGRNTLRFFDPQMQDAINTRAALEDELHKALENRQFQLHYQIQVDSLRRPMGAEALIRWEHPEHGLVSPAQFIQLAEDTGLILPIGLWVLDTACAQIKAWQHHALTRDLVLAVNVSAKQFRDPDFAPQVQAAVRRHGINPLRLKLELTESLLLENIEGAIDKMRTLKEFGVRISLDDFGTGYSSLFYLKRLPLDQIKIDQSFVRNITTDKGDVVMVRIIVELGMNFELDIIAEGLETEDQFKLLQRCGCSGFQGYLFGKPMPIEQFEELLKQG